MSTRMLIDARHSEETRVALVQGNKVEDFDYESSNKVQIKGNIYLAKITRVEPSLQAAFVEYGGNRHGFLAFSEIHPDYYQIPVEDREALLAAEAELMNEEPAPEEDKAKDTDEATDTESAEGVEGETSDKESDEKSDVANADDDEDDENNGEEDEDLNERLRLRQLRALKRRYKIQEVIKPRQIMLIQVVKEERGNKGAALTSYISLAGRYTVLMPNTTHGGGISRKISNVSDRKRLKNIVESLDIPAGTGCIIRTAGMKRTKVEIKRDVEYIQKTWNNIRDVTLKSTAPALVYEEGNLIKRAIRDLYDRSIDEVQVEGEESYKMAKDFMTLLMPSHAKRVHHYKDGLPLFQRYQIESQLDGMFNPNVTLKSGGYIVINPTEALIAIDVNSGKSTKQQNIEATAFKTNLEAAVEIGRQLRLRDLAGLVVIDFIDMESNSHNRKVESKMKEAVKADRARIMVNRISSLGLLEISRQRLRPNLEEASTEDCPHCAGSGRVRNKESAALHVLRGIEDVGYKGKNTVLDVTLNPDVAIYVLNKKRRDITALEQKYGVTIELTGNPELISPNYEIAASGAVAIRPKLLETPISNIVHSDKDIPEKTPNAEVSDGEDKPKRRRRRGGRGRGKYGRNRFHEKDGEQENPEGQAENAASNENKAEGVDTKKPQAESDENGEVKRPRRRGRRGGRRSRYSRGENTGENASENIGENANQNPAVEKTPAEPANDANVKAETTDNDTTPKKRAPRRSRKKADDAKSVATEQPTASDKVEEKPKRKPRKKPDAKVKADSAATEATKVAAKETVDEVKKPKPRRKTATSKDKDVDTAKAKPKETVAEEKPKAKRAAKADVKDDDSAKASGSKKKGWWQRK